MRLDCRAISRIVGLAFGSSIIAAGFTACGSGTSSANNNSVLPQAVQAQAAVSGGPIAAASPNVTITPSINIVDNTKGDTLKINHVVQGTNNGIYSEQDYYCLSGTPGSPSRVPPGSAVLSDLTVSTIPFTSVTVQGVAPVHTDTLTLGGYGITSATVNGLPWSAIGSDDPPLNWYFSNAFGGAYPSPVLTYHVVNSGTNPANGAYGALFNIVQDDGGVYYTASIPSYTCPSPTPAPSMFPTPTPTLQIQNLAQSGSPVVSGTAQNVQTNAGMDLQASAIASTVPTGYALKSVQWTIPGNPISPGSTTALHASALTQSEVKFAWAQPGTYQVSVSAVYANASGATISSTIASATYTVSSPLACTINAAPEVTVSGRPNAQTIGVGEIVDLRANVNGIAQAGVEWSVSGGDTNQADLSSTGSTEKYTAPYAGTVVGNPAVVSASLNGTPCTNTEAFTIEQPDSLQFYSLYVPYGYGLLGLDFWSATLVTPGNVSFSKVKIKELDGSDAHLVSSNLITTTNGSAWLLGCDDNIIKGSSDATPYWWVFEDLSGKHSTPFSHVHRTYDKLNGYITISKEQFEQLLVGNTLKETPTAPGASLTIKSGIASYSEATQLGGKCVSTVLSRPLLPPPPPLQNLPPLLKRLHITPNY